MYKTPSQSSRLIGGALITLIMVLLLSIKADAWQIISAHRIDGGVVALTDGPEGLWTAYEGDEDQLFRIINADNGELVGEVNQPENACNGLTLYEDEIWFVGDDNIYILNVRGEVLEEYEAPYETMHGLAVVEGEFWTMALDSGTYYLTLFEPGGEEIRRFSTDLHNPVGITWDGTNLWVTDRVDGFLHVFNPESEEEIDLFPTPFSQPTGIVYIDDELFLVDSGDEEDSDVLYRIDPRGENAPRLLPYSRNFDFGLIVLNSPEVRALPLFNIGNEELTIDSVRLANGQAGFGLGRFLDDAQIRPGASLNVPIIFNPRNYLHYHDTLFVYSNDPSEPEMLINITGMGIFASRRLGIYPDTLNFGTVRADPWRDGIRVREIAIFNKGGDEMRVDAIEGGIPGIFELEYENMPRRLQTAETLWVNVSFTPHRGITYIDTVLIYSNELRRINRMIILGTGNDSVYAAGSVLWSHRLEEGDGDVGGIAVMKDVNGDEIDEIVAVGPTGNAYCISGFASGEADVFWLQDFANRVFAPVGIESKDVMLANSDLNGDGLADAIIGSGGDDRSVYGLSGRNGEMLWRWESRSIQADGAIIFIESFFDYNGDGANDPVVLIEAEGDGSPRMARLNGANGRPIWTVNPGSATTVTSIADFDRDGVTDFITTGDDDLIRIFSGVDGGLMLEQNSPTGGQVEVAGDLNDDNEIDLIFGDPDGSITAWSIEDASEIWSVDQVGGVQLIGPVANLIMTDSDLNNDGFNELVGTDGGELIFCVNPINGEAIWTARVDNITMLTIISDTDLDSIRDFVVGIQNGSIQCISGQDGSALWGYPGQNGVDVISILAFDDTDLGGTGELVAVFSDNVVRCISTGGDLVSVEEEPYVGLPASPELLTLFPNPFNSMTTIGFSLTKASTIVLLVRDSNGRLVNNVKLGHYEPGRHKYLIKDFNSRNQAAGLYYFEIRSNAEHNVKSGILLK